MCTVSVPVPITTNPIPPAPISDAKKWMRTNAAFRVKGEDIEKTRGRDLHGTATLLSVPGIKPQDVCVHYHKTAGKILEAETDQGVQSCRKTGLKSSDLLRTTRECRTRSDLQSLTIGEQFPIDNLGNAENKNSQIQSAQGVIDCTENPPSNTPRSQSFGVVLPREIESCTTTQAKQVHNEAISINSQSSGINFTQWEAKGVFNGERDVNTPNVGAEESTELSSSKASPSRVSCVRDRLVWVRDLFYTPVTSGKGGNINVTCDKEENNLKDQGREGRSGPGDGDFVSFTPLRTCVRCRKRSTRVAKDDAGKPSKMKISRDHGKYRNRFSIIHSQPRAFP